MRAPRKGWSGKPTPFVEKLAERVCSLIDGKTQPVNWTVPPLCWTHYLHQGLAAVPSEAYVLAMPLHRGTAETAGALDRHGRGACVPRGCTVQRAALRFLGGPHAQRTRRAEEGNGRGEWVEGRRAVGGCSPGAMRCEVRGRENPNHRFSTPARRAFPCVQLWSKV